MDKISDVTIGDCKESKYLKPYRVKYLQDDVEKTWDVMKVHDSVAILVYHTLKKCFVLVKQFRPAIYLCKSKHEDEDGIVKIDTEKFPGSIGLTYELCAGIMDKDCSVAEVAKEELLEELGYKVPLYRIEKITSYRIGVGETGALQTLFYAEVSDVMKVGKGGGVAEEGELIETVEISLEQGRAFMYDESINRPISLMFALLWFFENKYSK